MLRNINILKSIGLGYLKKPREVSRAILPPQALRVPYLASMHGETREDEYFWLRDRGNPGVVKYLQEENIYTEAVMAGTAKLRDLLFAEMKARIKETDVSVPERVGGYFYYTRTEEGKQYEIHCRKANVPGAEEEIVLDENVLAEGRGYCKLGVFEISHDHKFLAYSVDTNGSEVFTLFIKNLETRDLVSRGIPNTYYSCAWSADSRSLFYVTLDHAKRPDKLFLHALDSTKPDVLLYHEKDDAFFVSVYAVRSKRFIFLHLESKVTTEVRYLDTKYPASGFNVFWPRERGIEYYVDHSGDRFFVRTNEGARNFRIISLPIEDIRKSMAAEIVPSDENVMIQRIEAFNGHLVLLERESGLKRICVIDLKNLEKHCIKLFDSAYNIWLHANPEFNTNLIRFSYESPSTPDSTYDYNMDTRQAELKKRQEILGGYDPGGYQVERIFVLASDGARIPVSLVYKKGLSKNAKNPLYLYGYGAYGVSIDPGFSSNRLSLLDRGFIYAIAHVRGGGEMGRGWYEEGKLLNKKNTFSDFITVAEYLIQEGYTSSELLAAAGASAGGLLIGAVANARPDLFKAMVADVPFVDTLNTMLDPSLPLTITEYEEWGDPNQKVYYDYIKSYAPYEHAKGGIYPSMLVIGALHDPRVPYWEPAKYVARLRSKKTDSNPLLLKTDMDAGHGGASGRYDSLREVVFEYAFIISALGLHKNGASSGFSIQSPS